MFKKQPKTFSEIVAPMGKKPNPFAKKPDADEGGAMPEETTAVRMVTGAKKKKKAVKKPFSFAKGSSLISKGMRGC